QDTVGRCLASGRHETGGEGQDHNGDNEGPGEFFQQVTGLFHTDDVAGGRTAELTGKTAALGILRENHQYQQETEKNDQANDEGVHNLLLQFFNSGCKVSLFLGIFPNKFFQHLDSLVLLALLDQDFDQRFRDDIVAKLPGFDGAEIAGDGRATLARIGYGGLDADKLID